MVDVGTKGPLVSMILTTRNRPRLLKIALACYAHQRYPVRELVVVDDGDTDPADEAAVHAVGGQVLRVAPGMPLGAKLNHGLEHARGSLCQKMDDDDWYGPDFLAQMVGTVMRSREEVCQPAIAFLTPFLFFDVARWEVRRSEFFNVPGATLLFARDDWEDRPFRGVRQDEDVWFVRDQTAAGAQPLPVTAPETYLAVRHAGSQLDRGHTWTSQGDGRVMEDYLQGLALFSGGPEAIVAPWALAIYRELQAELLCVGVDAPAVTTR